MKRQREKYINVFDYLHFILNKTLFQSYYVDNDDNTYPIGEWRGKLIGKQACGYRDFYFSSLFKSNVQLYVKYNLQKIDWIELWLLLFLNATAKYCSF